MRSGHIGSKWIRHPGSCRRPFARSPQNRDQPAQRFVGRGLRRDRGGLMPATAEPLLDEGTIAFTIESRVLRELGERLVKQPEVAIVELIKNSYDADATQCTIHYDPQRRISVEDDGDGITFDRFRDGWMRVGTSSKESEPFSAQYFRLI